MSFDVFGDLAERGYLRNHAGTQDLEKIKVLEHQSFRSHVERALNRLDEYKVISAASNNEVHKTLFADVYPWAGQQREQLAPNLTISKGGDSYLFAPGHEVGRALDYALRQGNDPSFMRDKPGEVMGSLAFAHPFFDGNGRIIMVVHAVFATRAGITSLGSSLTRTSILQPLQKK